MPTVVDTEDVNGEGLKIADFCIPFGPTERHIPRGFTFSAPTCKQNVMRLHLAFIKRAIHEFD